MADSAIQDLYNATEHVDDEMFDDAAQMLLVLGRMKTRGLGGKSQGSAGSATPSGGPTPRTTPKPLNVTAAAAAKPTSKPLTRISPRTTSRRDTGNGNGRGHGPAAKETAYSSPPRSRR